MSGKGTPRHNDTIQNRPEVETSSKPKVREEGRRSTSPATKNKRSSHPAPVASISCQTDGSDEKDVYRCPQCSLSCWLCNTKKFGDKSPPKVIGDNAMADETSIGTSSVTSSKTNRKRKRPEGWLGPKDKGFEKKILAVVGVDISEGFQSLKPKDVFPETTQRDTRIDSKIFLDIDREEATEISSQFVQFHQREYDENTLTKIEVKELAPFDRFIARNGPEVVRSLCRDRWKPGKEGPLVPSQLEHTYDWDIEPDMTYMVSINVLSQDLRKALTRSGLDDLLADPHGVSPYLTLEFKCSEKTGKDSDAKCQTAAASVVWLYQRLQIKLALNSDALNPANLADLQHYSIVLNSTGFQVWLARYDGKDYQVKMIDAGPIYRPEGIETYVRWWNAIHAWGLGTNAQSFRKDVEALWRKKMNEPANLGPTPPRSDGGAQTSASA